LGTGNTSKRGRREKTQNDGERAPPNRKKKKKAEKMNWKACSKQQGKGGINLRDKTLRLLTRGEHDLKQVAPA